MVRLENVTKKYDNTTILDKVNYKFNVGLTCLVGASGCGKTTLLNLVAGFDTSYDGSIKIGDLELDQCNQEKLSRYRHSLVGFIFQNYNLIHGYTALENVLMATHLDGDDENKKIKEAKSILTRLGLEEQIDQNVENLSGGQKQRVAIARTLIKKPTIILADEPTGALDSKASEDIMEILKDISKSKTVIIITHDKKLGEYADEIIKISDKKIVVEKCKDDKKIIRKKLIGKNGKTEWVEEIKEDLHKQCKGIEVNGEENIEKSIEKKSTLSFKRSTSLGVKNFICHAFKYLIVAIIIGFSMAAVVLAVGAGDIVNMATTDFQEQNQYISYGRVPKYYDQELANKDLNKVYDELLTMDKISDVYFQYIIPNVDLKYEGEVINMMEYKPQAFHDVGIMFGNMPEDNKNEILVSNNIAKQWVENPEDIVGKEITLEYTDENNEKQVINLKITGVSTQTGQSFILSKNVENEIYDNIVVDDSYAVAFRVEQFEDIITVHEQLEDKGFTVESGHNQVEAMFSGFNNLLYLYQIVSYVVLVVALFISIVILYRIIIERYSEVGLYSALGYSTKQIGSILFKESILLSLASVLVSMFSLKVINLIYVSTFGYKTNVTIGMYSIMVIACLILSLVVSNVLNQKLIRTEPAVALRK